MNIKFYVFTLLSFILFSNLNAQVSISGKVIRHNGDPVPGVTVSCTNAPDVISAIDGSFIFENLPAGENYFINGVFETDPLEGLSVLDILFMRDYILFATDPLPGTQLLAGDLNTPLGGAITTFDLVLLTRSILKIDNDIDTPYWYFFDGIGEEGGDPLQSFGIILSNVQEDVTGLELGSVKIGDMALKPDHYPAPANAPSTTYFMEDLAAAQGTQITIAVKVNDYVSIQGLQQNLSWDTGILEFVNYEGTEEYDWQANTNITLDGQLALLGGSLSGDALTLPDASTLYNLTFNVLQDFSSLEGLISFSDDIIANETIFRGDDEWLYILENNLEVITSIGTIETLESFEIIPNPVVDNTLVKIQFAAAEVAELELFDLSGKLLNNWVINGNDFSESISLEAIPAGTYMLKLRTQKGIATKKLIKQ